MDNNENLGGKYPWHLCLRTIVLINAYLGNFNFKKEMHIIFPSSGSIRWNFRTYST